MKNGFSLIEILIAIAVAAVVLPAVIILISFGSFTSGQGETYTKAYAIAQKEMEYIYGQKAGWVWDASSPVNNTSVATEDIFTKTVKIEGVLRCSLDGNKICSTGSNDDTTRKVTVEVSWNERGKNQDVTIESYVAKI